MLASDPFGDQLFSTPWSNSANVSALVNLTQNMMILAHLGVFHPNATPASYCNLGVSDALRSEQESSERSEDGFGECVLGALPWFFVSRIIMLNFGERTVNVGSAMANFFLAPIIHDTEIVTDDLP